MVATVTDIIRQTPPLLGPLYRLPTEILEIIFVHCARDYHNTASGEPVIIAPSWVNVSYVSRHWRNISLDCSALWTYLFVVSPRWTEELLVRSRRALLKVCLRPDHENNGSRWLCFLDQVMDHVERIEELSLHPPLYPGGWDDIGIQRYISKLASYGSAPCLRHLDISANWYSLDDASTLFGGDTPVLRTLHLSNCPVSLHSSKLSSLTTLSLHRVPLRSPQPTAAEILEILGCMQDLRHLCLVDALPNASPGIVINTFQKVKFPHLSRLHVSAQLPMIIALLSCAIFPLETELRLQCSPHHSAPHCDYAPLYPLLAQIFNRFEDLDQTSSSLAIRTLIIAFLEFGWATIAFSTSERDCDFPVYMTPVDWERNIPLQIICSPSKSISYINDILRSIPLENVESIHFIDPPYKSQFWTTLLGPIKHLRYLKLSDGYIPDLAPLLSFTHRPSTENEKGDDRKGITPALEELELDNILFLTTLRDDEDSLEHIKVLCDAFATRTEPRGRLVMTRCKGRGKGRNKKLQRFNMDGWWEGDRFHLGPYPTFS